MQSRSLLAHRLSATILTTTALYAASCLLFAVRVSARSLISTGAVTVYFVLPAIVLTYSLLALRSANRSRYALSTCSVALVLFALELFGIAHLDKLVSSLAASRDRSERHSRANLSGKEFDTRTREEVIADLKHSGIDAAPFLTPCNYLHGIITEDGETIMPLAGISDTRTVLGNETGDFLIYQSDRYGFHNPDELWNSDRRQIVGVGDSFTHGAEVSSDQNAIAVIREEFPSTLNLGTSGSGPLLCLGTLREYLTRVNPRFVVWFHFEGNDLLNLRNEYESPLIRYLDANFSQNLINRQPEIDSLLRRTQLPAESDVEDDRPLFLPMRSTLDSLIKLTAIRAWCIRTIDSLTSFAGRSERQFIGTQLERFSKTLKVAKAVTANADAQLIIVYLPQYERFRYTAAFEKTDQREEVLECINQLGIPVVDMTEDFEAHEDPLSLFPFRMNGHYNAAGYRLVGERVRDAVRAMAGSESRQQ